MQGTGTQPHSPRVTDRIEVILRQLDSLPTLGAVAVRLLELTTDDDDERTR